MVFLTLQYDLTDRSSLKIFCTFHKLYSFCEVLINSYKKMTAGDIFNFLFDKVSTFVSKLHLLPNKYLVFISASLSSIYAVAISFQRLLKSLS